MGKPSKMKSLLLLSALFLVASAAFGNGGEVFFPGGSCRPVGKGEFEVKFPKGSLRVAARNVLNKWRFVPVDDVVSAMHVTDGKLELDFEAVNPAGLETQDSLPLLIVLSGDCAGYPDGLVRLGKNRSIATFSSRNVWGDGDLLEMDMFRQRIHLSEKATFSFWKLGKDGKWSVRLHLRGEKREDGTTHYKQRLTFSTEDVRIAKPIDMPALKRKQYLRTLSPPQEPPLDVSRWIEICRNERSTNEDFSRLEDLFDVRSALYSARDALKHRPERDSEGEVLVERGYAALARMDIGEARAAADALEPHVKNSSEWMPLSFFPPLSWVKCWTQWGYVRAADGCSFLEPTPWNLAWQDGFRFCLAQDKRVAAANTKENPNTWEPLYLEPMPDVRVDRDWVSDRWIMSDGSRVTFSILTPVVDVDGVDKLVLGGFRTAPEMLTYVAQDSRPRYLRLTKDVQIEPEVVASVLMDFKKKPELEPPPTLGTQKIDPADVASPWLSLSSKQGGWQLLIFPGARPVSAAWKDGKFVLEMESRSHVGVMRAPGNLHGPEQCALAEFFAGVSVAPPVTCREERRDGSAVWRYTHLERRNAWGTAPRRIAPVPPLADFAGLAFKGAKTVKMPTKWNLFKYVDGDTAQCCLPAGMRREPHGWFGVNVSTPIDVEKTDPIMAHHPYWIRLVCGSRKSEMMIEEKCAELAEALEYCRRHSAKALIDSHGFKFYIGWDNGAEPAALKNFYDVWDAYSKVGAKYPDVVAGYDLYNEPGLVAGSEGQWREICAKATAIVRANHPGAPVYYSAVYGGNPNGLFNLEPLPPECEPQVATFHFYSPHSFTHQKVSTQNRGGDVCNFYPGWIPPIDWKGGNHWGGPGVSWGDRWMLAAVMLPAFELYAQYGVPMHVGEFSVVGFANQKSSRSACLWTKDSIDLFEYLGASWHLWNGGFGLGNERVRELVYGLWEKNKGGAGSDCNVRDFGAKGDGTTKDTVALQSAINACSENGGGRVVLSCGTYLSGAIQLKSGVELRIEKDARLLASPDIADFPDWPDAKHVVAANCPRGRSASFIFADECEDIAITGEGVIDGNGEAHVRRKTEPGWTGWEFERIRPMGESLPRVVFLAGCRNVRLEGVSLVNGPAGWGFWIHDCDRVAVRGLTIRSDVRYPNNDGLHVNCSRDVDISGCDIECGDDALVIRANSRSLKENKPCERVHVRDCRVRSWASGIRVGWCCDGVIRDCSFRRIAMRDTVNGIDIVMPPMPDNPDYGREATRIEDILFEDIDMDGLYAHPLDAKIEGDPDVTRVDAVRRITLRRVRATGLELPNIRGRKDAPFRDFLFEDCTFRRVSDEVLPGWERHGAANIGRTRPARFEHAEGFRLVRTEGWTIPQ